MMDSVEEIGRKFKEKEAWEIDAESPLTPDCLSNIFNPPQGEFF
jgi:hypothetical protein